MPRPPIDDAVTLAYLKGLEDAAKGVPGFGGEPRRLPEMVHQAWGGIGGAGSDWLRQLQPGSDYDYTAQAGDLWKNTAVAACLRVYKQNFPQPELQVRRVKGKGQGQVLPKHKLIQLINRPNPGYDRYALWSSFCVAALCDGNAYLLKIRSRAMIPVELWWIPPWQMRPVWSASGADYITAYQYQVNGKTYLIPPEDVIHYRHGGPDPRNDRSAMSELKAAAARTVCGLNEVDGYTATIMRNMGIVPVVIAPAFEGGRINIDDADTIRSQWRERTTGERRGEPFVNPGAFTITKLAMSPEEMKLDAIPARLEDQIAAMTGVPAMLAGLTSGAKHKTYANYGEARRSFYEDTLIPMQGAVAECLEHQLLGDPGMGNPDTETIAFSYDRIMCLQEEQNAIWTRVTTAYKENVIKRSEARDQLGLEWDDEDEVYKDATTPSEPAVMPGVPPAVEPEEDDATEPTGKSLGVEHRRPFAETKDHIPDRGAEGMGGEDVDPSEDNTYGLPNGNKIRRELKRWWTQIEAEYMAAVEDAAEQLLGTSSSIGVPLTDVFPAIADYEDPMSTAMTPLLSAYWDKSGRQTRAKLGLDPDEWRVVDPNLHEKIRTQAMDFCESTLETAHMDVHEAYDRLRQELLSGVLEAGEAIPQLTERVKAIFTDAKGWKAEQIARTEAARAVNAASLESAKQSGVVERKKWLLSANACDECHKVNDRVNAAGGIPLDDAFATGLSDKPTYADCHAPPLHPHCRCTLTYVLSPEFQGVIDQYGPKD